jgi:hypothetical protein
MQAFTFSAVQSTSTSELQRATRMPPMVRPPALATAGPNCWSQDADGTRLVPAPCLVMRQLLDGQPFLQMLIRRHAGWVQLQAVRLQLPERPPVPHMPGAAACCFRRLQAALQAVQRDTYCNGHGRC